MSGASAFDEHERIVLAGEFVLGTLPRDEAERVVDEAIRDPKLADAIADWERHLAPLAATVSPVTPPAALWPRLETSAFGLPPVVRPAAMTTGDASRLVDRQPGRPRRVAGSRSLTAWKGATAASFLLAASIAGISLLDRVPMATPVAVLAPLGAVPAAFAQASYVVEARADGVVSVLPLHAMPVPTGHDLELWSLAAGEKVPHPLGVLPAGGVRLAAGRLPNGPGQILISLEPQGGSPTGLPTGPVLYGGAVTRSD